MSISCFFRVLVQNSINFLSCERNSNQGYIYLLAILLVFTWEILSDKYYYHDIVTQGKVFPDHLLMVISVFKSKINLFADS